jgi:hypothetical protein
MYFYFEQVFRNAVTGINTTAVPSTIVQIGGAILLACLMFNVYEAWVRGGDVRTLGVGAVKYLTMGLVLLNYSPIFLGVNTMFNQVAEYISSVGPGGMDVFNTWLNDAGRYTQASPNFMQSLWPAVSGGIPGILETLLLLVGYIVYAVTYPLFCIFYAFYGSVLYVCAPLVLALYPALSTTGLARTYLMNLFIFHAWGLIYAILGCLMSAIHLGTVAEVLARGDAGGFFAGTGEALLLGLTSILLAVCIALIPMIARRVVQGDIGSTLFAVMSAAITAATLGASMAINGAAGLTRGLSGGHERSDPAGGGGGGGNTPGGSGRPSMAEQSSQKPPTAPAEPGEVTQRADVSGTDAKAPAGARDAESALVPETASAVGGAADAKANSGDGADAASHGARPSGGSRWSSGARAYTPMSLTALAAMGTGTLLGTGLRRTAQTFGFRSAGRDDKD